jgi:ABC-2 type transport system permease protein
VFAHPVTGEQWAQIGVTGLTWLVISMAVWLWFVMRAEVK